MGMEKFAGKTKEELETEIRLKQEESVEAQAQFDMEKSVSLDKQVEELQAELNRLIQEATKIPEDKIKQVKNLGGTGEELKGILEENTEKIEGVKEKIKFYSKAEIMEVLPGYEKFKNNEKRIGEIFLEAIDFLEKSDKLKIVESAKDIVSKLKKHLAREVSNFTEEDGSPVRNFSTLEDEEITVEAIDRLIQDLRSRVDKIDGSTEDYAVIRSSPLVDRKTGLLTPGLPDFCGIPFILTRLLKKQNTFDIGTSKYESELYDLMKFNRTYLDKYLYSPNEHKLTEEESLRVKEFEEKIHSARVNQDAKDYGEKLKRQKDYYSKK